MYITFGGKMVQRKVRREQNRGRERKQCVITNVNVIRKRNTRKIEETRLYAEL